MTSLDAFAKHYDLARRVQFNTFVKNAEFRGSSGWLLQLIYSEQGQSEVHAKKLVITSSHNPEAAAPELPGM